MLSYSQNCDLAKVHLSWREAGEHHPSQPLQCARHGAGQTSSPRSPLPGISEAAPAAQGRSLLGSPALESSSELPVQPPVASPWCNATSRADLLPALTMMRPIARHCGSSDPSLQHGHTNLCRCCSSPSWELTEPWCPGQGRAGQHPPLPSQTWVVQDVFSGTTRSGVGQHVPLGAFLTLDHCCCHHLLLGSASFHLGKDAQAQQPLPFSQVLSTLQHFAFYTARPRGR